MAGSFLSRAGWLCGVLGVLAGAGVSLAAEAGATQPAAPQSAVPATRPTYAADSPAQWLSVQGKSDRWIEATERCRALFDPLQLDDPLVKTHLPSIRRQIEVIRRVDGFNWKTVTAVEFLQNALEDLQAGKTPNRRYAGKQLAFPYWSDRMGRIEAVWMHVPASYDPARSHQLFMYYKSGGGIHNNKGKAAGGYRPTIEMANKADTFHAWSSLNIQIKGRLGAQIELEEFPAALAREFSVSPDRIFLTGYSDGGFTALWLATHYPHLVAGIAPNCANWQYTNTEAVNLLNVPYLVVDGWGDSGYVEMNFLRFVTLANMGYDVSAIFGQHGHTYTPFEDEETFLHIMNWASAKKRDLWPRHVCYATWNLTWHRAYWLSIERVIDPALLARIDAQVKDGNRIEVTASNVAAYKMQLSDKLVNPAKPVAVITNGKASYEGPYKQELRIELAPRPASRFVKDATMPGGITEQIVASTYDANGYLQVPDRRWLFVKGTAGDEETLACLATWFPKDAKADRDVTDEDLARFNLFLYGGPAINRLTARMAGDLPVKFDKGQFTLGRSVYDDPSECIAFIHPNPLNPRKYVIVYAFNDAETFVKNKHFGLMDLASAWSFRTGDGVVAGIPAPSGRPGAATDAAAFRQRHFIFDAAWRADRDMPLGELKAPFDRQQVLRLRAEAIREAAEADVGIIWSDTPNYLVWNKTLPAGPVTTADLATLDALPESITLGEMTGAQLRKAHPAAWSVVPGKDAQGDDPQPSLATADIDPQKTYRVAMGYFGQPAYGTNPGKMPRTFTFASEKQFLASDNNSLGVQHMRQIPLEVTEAVAQYIRKRGSVAPHLAPAAQVAK